MLRSCAMETNGGENFRGEIHSSKNGTKYCGNLSSLRNDHYDACENKKGYQTWILETDYLIGQAPRRIEITSTKHCWCIVVNIVMESLHPRSSGWSRWKMEQMEIDHLRAPPWPWVQGEPGRMVVQEVWRVAVSEWWLCASWQDISASKITRTFEFRVITTSELCLPVSIYSSTSYIPLVCKMFRCTYIDTVKTSIFLFSCDNIRFIYLSIVK